MFRSSILLITLLILGLFYWIGLSINHLVIIGIFAASIIFGALIIADEGEEKRESMYDDYGQSATSDNKNSEKSF